MIIDMVVLLVDLGSGPHDAWAQTLLLARSLHSRGDSCLLLCPEGSDLAEQATALNLPVRTLRLPTTSLSLWLLLRKLVSEHNITIIHTLDETALLAAAFLRHKQGMPLVHSLHLLGKKRSRWGQWAIKQVDSFVDTGYGIDALRAENGDADSGGPDLSRIKTILPSLPLQGADACPPRQERHDGRFIFVSAGHLTPEADWNALLQAIAYLQNMDVNIPPWEVRILGEGPLFDDVLASAELLGVQSRISLLGRQNWRDFLPTADAVVIPAASGPGNVPLILAAWQCGLPVACTALPAHQALGADKVSLLLTPPSNAVALAGSMLRLMQDAEKCQAIARGGQLAFSAFAPSRMADAYATLYTDVTNRVALLQGDTPSKRSMPPGL